MIPIGGLSPSQVSIPYYPIPQRQRSINLPLHLIQKELIRMLNRMD
jgi:hypothetical protein